VLVIANLANCYNHFSLKLLKASFKSVKMAEVSRLEAKIIAMAVIFVVMFVCGLLPIWVAKWVKDKGAKGALVISVLRCFGGGVFFGAYLLHSAPDVRFVLENAWLIPSGITYPMSELFTGCGFFFIMFLEQFIGYWSLRHTRKVKVVLVSNAAQAEGDIRVQVYNGDANEAFDNPADVKVVDVKVVEALGQREKTARRCLLMMRVRIKIKSLK
jgi:hypothetical protein